MKHATINDLRFAMETPAMEMLIHGKDENIMATSSKGPAHVGRGVPRAGIACLSILLAALIAFIQPVLPSAFQQGVGDQAEAYAMTGSTNYQDLFTVGGPAGASMGANGLLTCGDLNRPVLQKNVNGNFWGTNGSLISKNRFSLLHDWTISATAHFPEPAWTSAYDSVDTNFQLNFYDLANRIELHYSKSSTGLECFIHTQRKSDLSTVEKTQISYPGMNPTINIAYDAANDKLTFSVGSNSHVMKGIRKNSSDSQTVALNGNVVWRERNHSDTRTTPPNMSNMTFKFNSMTIPHLDPEIRSLNVYPEGGTTPYGKNDMIRNGSTVRVECVVRTTNALAGGERFPLHLKTVTGNASYPTQGITPFINSSHPLKVENGSSTSTYTSGGADSIVGANGTPVVINGTNDCKITYYATVNRTQGQAVKLSQCLTEDSFQGTYYKTIELFSEQGLIEGTSAGSHYSRSPKANANGWNNSGPVTLTFNPGTAFDSFVVKDASGKNVAVLNASNPTWSQAGDTSGVSLTYQAQSSAYATNTTTATDTIKIDTHTPTLAYDKATNTLAASDVPADDVHATSGIWKVIRAEKQNQSTCAATDGRIYGAQGGVWSATQTYVPLPGTYVAVDAAGNVSGSVEVPAFGAPEVTRPVNAPVGPGGDGTQDYAGPVLNGPLPEAVTTTNPSTGLQQTTIDETWFELVDGSMGEGDLPFGGTLDKEAAKQVIEHNYSFASPATDSETEIQLVTDVKLIDKATGREVTSVPTDKTSQTIIQATVTDPQGNKAIVSLPYQVANKDDLPQITPKPGTPDPKDVFGELVVKGNEKEPSPLEVRDVAFVPETGKLTGRVDASVSITVQGTIATPEDIARMISNRYEASSLVGAIGEGGEGLTKGDVTLLDADGNQVTEIDLAKPGRHVAVQTFTDKNGNTTVLTVELVCKRRPSAPEVEGTADPLDPSSEVRIDPDKSGTVDDAPYFEHDPDKPLNILDAIQTRPEGENEWSPIAGGSSDDDVNGSGSGNGNGNGSGDGNGSGNEGGSNPGATPDQLPSNVQVTVTDESGRPVDPTTITDPGTYEVTVSVKDPDTGELVVIETIKFHVVDTSITDTDYIYKDVAKDHWGHDYIFDIGPKVINGAFNPSNVALGYMAGYAGTTNFGPQNDIIRGDAAIVVWRMAGCPDVEGDANDPDSPKLLSLANTYYTGFADCDASPTMYYNKAIAWCAANGIVEGYGDTGLYLPQNQIAREEFASIIARYASFKGKDVSSASADLSQYPDIDDVSDWAAPNMHYVVSSGIMTGKGTDEGTAQGTHGILDPQAHVTRAEVAKMTYMEQPTRP